MPVENGPAGPSFQFNLPAQPSRPIILASRYASLGDKPSSLGDKPFQLSVDLPPKPAQHTTTKPNEPKLNKPTNERPKRNPNDVLGPTQRRLLTEVEWIPEGLTAQELVDELNTKASIANIGAPTSSTKLSRSVVYAACEGLVKKGRMRFEEYEDEFGRRKRYFPLDVPVPPISPRTRTRQNQRQRQATKE